jgi:dihydrofolate reductase
LIRAILAHDAYWGIGKDGDLPWPKNSDDLAWFKECTTDGVVVMGRKTWESLPKKPLPGRTNAIVTTQPIESGLGNIVVNLDILLDILPLLNTIHQNVWIIGGAQLIEGCLHVIEELWLNNVGGDYNCDTFLPKRKITAQFEPGSIEIKSFGIITKWTRRKDATIS